MTNSDVLSQIRNAIQENRQSLNLSGMEIKELPPQIGHLTNLRKLYLYDNYLTSLPEAIGDLSQLEMLSLHHNQLTTIPDQIGRLTALRQLILADNQLLELTDAIGGLANLQVLNLSFNELTGVTEQIGQLSNLEELHLSGNKLVSLPSPIGQLPNLRRLSLANNALTDIPREIGDLVNLEYLNLNGNPLTPPLASAYHAGSSALRAYLNSLTGALPLYEAKLVFIGEGTVGKTTLLKAITNQKPTAGEQSTYGAKINIKALSLPHPDPAMPDIIFHAWDFGGQPVYRITHQFFFSRNAIYLLVWNPNLGKESCLIREWLDLIRLRVGGNVRVVIVATHCQTGHHLVQIDRAQLRRDYGPMIAGFYEVDSLTPDPDTGKMVGVAELKVEIAKIAANLEQMGMEFNPNWTAAQNALLSMNTPRISYAELVETCAEHDMDGIAARTLAELLHDIGCIVYYGDDDRLKDEVILHPEWLIKAIGFMLEDQITVQNDGILPDSRLKEIWWDNPVDHSTRFEPRLYPFFLRLMEKYDILYRLEGGDTSLVAQHVPEEQPTLPWRPEDGDTGSGLRLLTVVCIMDEVPSGLVPWMIVRTHNYARPRAQPDGHNHRLHWRSGMFLRNAPHGTALLELRGHELFIYVKAGWPENFMIILQETLQNLIDENWPGMKGRYRFAVPCPTREDDRPCRGRFKIASLQNFLTKGDLTTHCHECETTQEISRLLHGFEEKDLDEQLRQIEENPSEAASRKSNIMRFILKVLADESKSGPRLFTIEATGGPWWRFTTQRYKLHVWCEAEDCWHPVSEEGGGIYEFDALLKWVRQIAPYIKIIAGVLRMYPLIAELAIDTVAGAAATNMSGVKETLDRQDEAVAEAFRDEPDLQDSIRFENFELAQALYSGTLAIHAILHRVDPFRRKLGLLPVRSYTGDYLWLCPKHYAQHQSKIPERIDYPVQEA